MADLIDKQELYDYIQKEKAWEQSRTRLPRYERGLPDACYEMLDKLNEYYAKQLECTIPKVYISTDLQPTVETVKHARWVIRFESIYQKYVDGKCSNCGYTDYCLDENGFYNYCPNCGAKMDEVMKE